MSGRRSFFLSHTPPSYLPTYLPSVGVHLLIGSSVSFLPGLFPEEEVGGGLEEESWCVVGPTETTEAEGFLGNDGGGLGRGWVGGWVGGWVEEGEIVL